MKTILLKENISQRQVCRLLEKCSRIKNIKNVVNYILSKKESFENLTYRIYPMKGADDRDINENKLIKRGELTNNLAAFDLSEI